MSKSDRNILLCAGGTGGHLFPAQALARVLKENGWQVHLATDERAERFTSDFPAVETHIVKSATIGGRNPFKMLKALFTLGSGYRQSKTLISSLKPAAVIGFGGYPTLPPVMAASAMRVPILLHEQNAVMGRANRLLAKKAKSVAMGFGVGTEIDDPKIVVLGNPVRSDVLKAAGQKYPKRNPDDVFNLLVFGGSQGAQYFSEVVPKALAILDISIRRKISLVQQARPEDEAQLKSELKNLKIKSEVSPFFSPMSSKIAAANFVVSRAGASTVSELAVIGRPSLLVPYPFALDHDQAMNAAEMEKSGGCKVIKQAELSAEKLAEEIQFAMTSPDELAQMAVAVKETGKPCAAVEFARLIDDIVNDASANT